MRTSTKLLALRWSFAALLLTVCVAVSGCGNKGPLVRPQDAPQALH